MTEIAVRETQALAPMSVDSWVGVLANVYQLARGVCDTEFVPDAMRGRPEAVAATILMGRELNVGPMTALQHVHVIKGKTGMSAQLMRQKILEAGHLLRYVETSDTRCVVEGKRRGESEWTRVTFTADQAKKASIALGQYPEDKLVARATSRLARRKFADCLGPAPYLPDELEDGQEVAEPAAPAAASDKPPARRTAQRKARPAPLQPPAPTLDEPPALEATAPALDAEPEQEMASLAQLTAMATAMTALDYRTRQDQHQLVARMLGRDIGSAKEVTAQEAHSLLDDFTQAQASGDPQAYLDDLLNPVDQHDG